MPPPAQPEMVVVIGGSAGSIEPLARLLSELPTDLPAAVLVTVHLSSNGGSALPAVLARRSPLPVEWAEDETALSTGKVVVARPGLHLLVHRSDVRLSGGARINRHRPAVDALFASAARWFGAQTVGVVLSGVLDDGSVGAAQIARTGGVVLIQDPREAEFAGMPSSALRAVPGARTHLTHELAGVIADIVKSGDNGTETRRSAMTDDVHDAPEHMGDSDDPGFLKKDETRLTRLACPECGGSLAEIDLAAITYFRCHVGHQYAPRTLAAAQSEVVEAKLWSAVAAMEEQAAVERYVRTASGSVTGNILGTPPDTDPDSLSARVETLRRMLTSWTGSSTPASRSDPDPS